MTPSRREHSADAPAAPPRDAVSLTHDDPRLMVVHQRFAQFDYEKGLELVVALLEDGRTDAMLLDCLREAHRGLKELYAFALEAPDRIVARASLGDGELVLELDPVYTFVHDFVDGTQSVRAVIAATRLAPPVAMQAMFALVQSGVVELL